MADFENALGYVGSDPVLRQRRVRAEEMEMVVVALLSSREHGRDYSAVRIVGPGSGSGEIRHGVGRIVSNAAHDISRRFNLGYGDGLLIHMPRPFNPAGGMYLDVSEPLWEVILHDRLCRAEDMIHFWNVERRGGPPSWPSGIGPDFVAVSRKDGTIGCSALWTLRQMETFLDFAEKVGDLPFTFPEPAKQGFGGDRLFTLLECDPDGSDFTKNRIRIHETAIGRGENGIGKFEVDFSLAEAS